MLTDHNTRHKPPSFLLQCMLTDLRTNRNTSQTFFILTLIHVNRSSPHHNTRHKPSSFLPWYMSTDLHLTTTQATNLLHSDYDVCQQIITLTITHKPPSFLLQCMLTDLRTNHNMSQTFFILTLIHVNRSSPYHNTSHKPSSFLPWYMSTDLHLTTTQATNLLHSYPDTCQQIFTSP